MVDVLVFGLVGAKSCLSPLSFASYFTYLPSFFTDHRWSDDGDDDDDDHVNADLGVLGRGKFLIYSALSLLIPPLLPPLLPLLLPLCLLFFILDLGSDSEDDDDDDDEDADGGWWVSTRIPTTILGQRHAVRRRRRPHQHGGRPEFQ